MFQNFYKEFNEVCLLTWILIAEPRLTTKRHVVPRSVNINIKMGDYSGAQLRKGNSERELLRNKFHRTVSRIRIQDWYKVISFNQSFWARASCNTSSLHLRLLNKIKKSSVCASFVRPHSHSGRLPLPENYSL